MTLLRKMLLAMFLMVACLAVAAQAQQDTAEETYRQFIQAKEYAKAESIIRRLLVNTDVRSSRRGIYEADLLRVVRLSGRAELALKMSGSLNRLQRIVPQVRLEVARCQIELRQLDAAEKDLRLFNDVSDKKMGAYVSFELARIAFERKKYQSCVKLCRDVIATIRPMGDDLRYDPDLRKLLADAEALIRAAKDALIAEKYGEDYLRYVRGRRAQARGDAKGYESAIKEFQPITTPILLDAAQCYTCQCLIELGRRQEAVAACKAFVASDRFGLYRGEALYNIGRMLMVDAQSAADFQQGVAVIADAVAWIQAVEQEGAEIDLSRFKAALKEFPPPEQMMMTDRLGNYHRSQVSPETVFNRLTAKWYLPRLKMQILLLHAFCLNEAGRRDDAIAAIGQALVLNKGQAGRILNYDDMPDRLLVDVKDGAFFVPTDIWDRFRSFEGLRVRLAYFYLVAGEYEQAKDLFVQVVRTTQNNPSERETLAGAKLGLACLTFISGGENAALAELAQADNVFARTAIDPLALIIRANILAGQSAKYQEAADLYASVTKRYGRSDYAARALLGWLVMAANAGRSEDAMRIGQQLIAKYPHSEFAAAARTLVNDLMIARSTTVGASATGSLPGVGIVVPFSRHLVIPGDVDINVELWQRNIDDILSYRLDYSVRAGCGLRMFRLNLTPLEPQVPPVKGKQLAFYRVPAFLLASGSAAGR